jgi:transposase
MLVNAQHIKAVPGPKTHQKDSEWIADLLQHGLLRGSFVPPKPMRELRELTRYRVTMALECNRIANRIQKVLEDANIKLASVARDPLGASGRAMLKAILAGEGDADRLADMSKGLLRNKIPELRLALEASDGAPPFSSERVARPPGVRGKRMAEVEAEIERRMRPFEAEVERLDTIPGVDRVTAWSLIAEIGVTMD